MEIILYDARRLSKKHFEAASRQISVFWQSLKPESGQILKWSGYSLLILSSLILLISFGPIAIQEVGYRVFQRPLASSEKSFFKMPSSENQPRQVAEEAAEYGVPTDFSIVIPKISAKARIIPNVDPADEKAYKTALKQGVAHATGTKFPGNKGIVYLFAHSTNSPVNISRYNAVFYLLKELRQGDQIIVFFAGQKYVYQVTERLVTAADDTQWLTKQEKEERLVLQTCWPPGTSQKRLLVIARPV